MQWPPTPGPGVNFMKPNGLVAAASMTSHTSTPSLSHTIAISLTSPMFTLRNVFSRILTSSADSVDDTGTSFSIAGPVRAAPPWGDAQHQLAGRGGVRGGLEPQELAAAERLLHGIGRREHVADVGVLGLGERRRYANRDRIGLAQPRQIRGCDELPGLHRRGDRRRRHVLDVRLAVVQQVDDLLAHVEPDHAVARAHEFHDERQADVPQPDDPAERRAIFGLGEQRGDRSRHRASGAPPDASERDAASSTRTTRTPSSAPAPGRGVAVPRATRTKCDSSAASGSIAGMRGTKMSPSRIARLSPKDPYSGGRSTPLS